MLTAYVVPYLEGDIQDENHVRVEHWGIDLSGRDVLLVEKDLRTYGYRVDQNPREIRNVSAMWGRKSHTPTILLHLKPLPRKSLPRLRCADLSTAMILKRVLRKQCLPTLSEYVFDNDCLITTPGARLLKRKEDKLYTRGYISARDHNNQVIITQKGLDYLEKNDVRD
jgi:hypothetical protein